MGLFEMDDGESYAIKEEWIKNYLNDIVQETELVSVWILFEFF